MKLYLYCDFDKKASVFGPIHTEFADPENMKANILAAAREGKIDHKADDLDIYLVGEFDNIAGTITEKKELVSPWSYFSYYADDFRRTKEAPEEKEAV